MKKPALALALAALVAAGALALTGCTAADVASHNLSQDADNFKVHRQVVFHNDLTDTYIAEVEGLCSLGNDDADGETTVTCKIGDGQYVKEIFRMGDNTSVSAIQTEPTNTNPYHYKVIFRPETVIPDIQVDVSGH
jgi:hypothetical protein